MPYILQTNGLTKAIGGKNLVTNVSMHVKRGEIYGFLGPNGAGKTTVMKMLTNLWKPTEGSIELFGQKLTPTSYGVLKRMGSIIEFPTFYDHLSGKENLALLYMNAESRLRISMESSDEKMTELSRSTFTYFTTWLNVIENVKFGMKLSGVPAAEQEKKAMYYLEMVHLTEYRDYPIHQISGGMRQRTALARALTMDSKVLLMDEPFSALDKQTSNRLREELQKI